MLQLDYQKKFNEEERKLYASICEGLQRQMDESVLWLKSDEGKKAYNERSEYLDYFWEYEMGLPRRLDNIGEYNAVATRDNFIAMFYSQGIKMGVEVLNKPVVFTPADIETLDFIKQNSYDSIKNLNNDVKNSIKNIIFEDIAQNNSYQKTINKIRELPLNPTANGKLSPDVRARFIARTERARARGYGSLQAYVDYGVEYYELITRGKKACNICIDLEANNPYHISDSRAYVPIHPNCICSNAPYIPDGQTLRDTPVDFPVSIADYVDLTMNPNRL